MNAVHDLLLNEDGYNTELQAIFSLLHNTADLKDWFNTKLVPIMLISNLNYLQTYRIVYGLAKQQYSYIAIIELLNEYSKRNADMKFISESCRFNTNSNCSPELLNSIMNIVSTGTVANGDVIKLHRLYTIDDTTPSIEYLQSFDVIEPLMRQIFGSGSSIQSIYKTKILSLIAHATFSTDINTQNDKNSNKEQIQAGYQSLVELDKLLVRVRSMNQIQDYITEFIDYIKIPVLASAIIMWLKRKLFDDDFYEWTSFSLGETPPAFTILDEVAYCSSSHCDVVFEIWVALLERTFDMMDPKLAPLVVMQYRIKFMDHIILLFHSDYQKPILDYLAAKVKEIDPSLMAHFLKAIIRNIVTDVSGPVLEMLKLLLVDVDLELYPELLAFFTVDK